MPEYEAAVSELYPPRMAEECSLLPRQKHKEPVRAGQTSWFTACNGPHFEQNWPKGLNNEHHSTPMSRECEQRSWKGQSFIEGR